MKKEITENCTERIVRFFQFSVCTCQDVRILITLKNQRFLTIAKKCHINYAIVHNLILFTLFTSILLLSIASAELIITQPRSIYNFGDSFDISIKIIPQKDANSFFTATLVCSGDNVELYRSPVKLNIGEEKE